MTQSTVTTKKRVRRDPEETRRLILDAAQALMVREGYGAVSTRQVAAEAGLTPALLHYYYATTDDLFIALHQRMTATHTAELEQTLANGDPLAALWRFQSGWSQSALGVEFIGLANHRKAIRAEITRRAEEARAEQAQAIAPLLAAAGVDPALCPPVCAVVLLTAVARLLANEAAIGITLGHPEVRRFIDATLASLNRTTPQT
ncbi:MAG: TetR/AcrR family transcriptional regulator [Sphingomonadales bacterium]|nr:TetR/AcrR family transcriptional regulator [Sphingomonadales bacterium]